jgi:dTMP kinase
LAGGEPGGVGTLRPAGVASVVLERLRDEGLEVPRPRHGVLVAVEGIDGAGVSTTADALARLLGNLWGGGAVYTKEPTTGPVGLQIWQSLSGVCSGELRNPLILALLFAADRLWHLLGHPLEGGGRCMGVLGCLSAGYTVVTDRYKYSSIAYQQIPPTAGIGVDAEWIWLVNAYAPPAHVLVYLDLPVEAALERIRADRWQVQLYEKRKELERVRGNFRRLIESLKLQPEGPRGSPRWVALLESRGLSVEELYPASGYPVIVEVDASKPPSEVLYSVVVKLSEALPRV